MRHRQKNAKLLYLRSAHGSLSLLLVVFAVVLLASVILLVTPSRAYAKDYAMPRVDIAAEAKTDGSLNIIEQRTFDFDGSFRVVWWNFSGLPENARLHFNGVSLAKVDAQGEVIGEDEQITEEPFVLTWRESNDGLPPYNAYSIDSARDSLYVIFNASNESLRVTLDYTVLNGVQAYEDVGEIYWKYISDGWEEASENVSMTLTLPVPSNIITDSNDDVRAWGHGPLDGSLQITSDHEIVYQVNHVDAGQYAEARVVFPVEWLTDLSDDATSLHKNEHRLDTVLREEQIWADQANLNRVFSLAFVFVCGLLAVLVLLWAIRSYLKHGKEHAPEFTEEYWRDVPSPQDHPAVIARLWRWNKESDNDFTATLMHLSHKGAITINKGSYEKPDAFDSKVVDDYYLVRVPAVANTLTNPIDVQTMNFLFETIAQGADSLWFASIGEYGKNNAQEFIDEMQSWQGIVSSETNKRDFFELAGQKKQLQMVGLAVLLFVIGIVGFVFLKNFIPLLFLIPTTVALFFIAKHMPRRSREGNNLDAKCKALRNWLKDFSSLDERPPTDVKVWGEFMVYAYLFGVAKQVIQALQFKVPELFQDDTSTMGFGYVPWWFWYGSSYGITGAGMPAASDLLQTSMANTISTAQAALSTAKGGFSSGGGFGGGFSGGGGGGFGGGGGAR